jgi:hypothetical protein
VSTITFYGVSDDLASFDIDGRPAEEFDAYNKRWRGVIEAPDGDSLAVTAEFGRLGPHAGWTLGVENTGSWPSWPIQFGNRPDRDDDPALIIEAPDGATIKEALNA